MLLHQLSCSSSITDKGQYLAISTPELPHYFSGNFLMFQKPPGVGDLERWESLFHFKAFVIIADQAGAAASVYKSVGFKMVEHGASLIRRA